jgi:glycosyltransferase involved in cell wall biosynthesis
MNNKDIIILSTAEWSNPFWTNKQHVAVALEKMGYRVFYIDSLGLRRPSASSQDFNRILKRLKTALRPPKEVKDNIWVWSPIILPFQSISWVRRFNRLLFGLWLGFWLKRRGFQKSLLWTYNPLTTRILDVNKFDNLVYHCVDEIKAQPGMPVQLLEEAESELIVQSSVIFTTAKQLYETRKKLNEKTFYFSNVADFDHFQKALLNETVVPDDLDIIPKPRAGFIGALSGYKVDFKLIRQAATENPDVSFVLIGKVGEGDPWSDVSALEEINNIYFLGPKKYADLPAYLKGFDVAMLPNTLNEYTDSMFPMKFFEYLAAGRPVVSVDLISLSDFHDVCFLSESYKEFSKNIRLALNDTAEELEKRVELAREYTYDSRMKKMMAIVED